MWRIICLNIFFLSSSHAALNNSDASLPFNIIETQRVIPSDVESDKQDPMPGLLKRLKIKAGSEIFSDSFISDKVSICETCHSVMQSRGNSYLPILQGQNQEYLFAKIMSFKNNKRSMHPFPLYTERLTINDIMDVSLYYARQRSDLNKILVMSAFPVKKTEAGKNYNLDGCTDCHGSNGNGEQLIPVITGQNAKYLSYRIREISADNSRVHRDSVAGINCHIPQLNIRESEQLARQLAMVFDASRVGRGAEIYDQNCSGCHDQGQRGAPQLSDKKTWSEKIRQGTRELVKNTLIGKNKMPFWGGNIRLSRNQITDAIHYMIKQASLSE